VARNSTNNDSTPAAPVVIFGLGFTGRRVAQRLAARGVPVLAPRRDESLAGIPRHLHVLHTIPPLDAPENEALRLRIASVEPARIVYISSTGVYGAQSAVDSNTRPAPEENRDDRARRRLAEEQWISSGPWSSLILRSAAIYGPNRGVHVAAREGRLPRGAGSGIVSRIHVDDLAAIAEAGLFSSLTGAWPVADEKPCPSDEIIRFINPQFEIPLAPASGGRHVNGAHIREILGVSLLYPSWESGVLASLAAERDGEGIKPEQMDANTTFFRK
jgi:nucleoside-diphosphate-sugar epimerase